MLILRINGLTLTTTSTVFFIPSCTTSTRQKENYPMQLIFLFSEWDLRLFFSKVYDVLDVVYFRFKGHLKLLSYFSFFPISCFLPPKQELYLINSLNVIIYHWWQETSSTCVGANFRTMKDHEKKTEIITDQKPVLAGRSRFRFLFVVVDVYMERKSRFLRAKNALVECFLYL